MKDQELKRLRPADQLKLILLNIAPMLPVALSALAEMKIEGNQGLIPAGVALGVITLIGTSGIRNRLHIKRMPTYTEPNHNVNIHK